MTATDHDAPGELGTCEDDMMQWAPDEHKYIRLAYILLGAVTVGLIFAAGFLTAVLVLA